jgi:hypothetical protein
MPRPIDIQTPGIQSPQINDTTLDGAQQVPGILVPTLLGRATVVPSTTTQSSRSLVAVAAVLPDAELETPPLPRDLPHWVKDALSVSARARELISRLKPVAIRILTFWDHRLRTAIITGRHLKIDPSGSYRAE